MSVSYHLWLDEAVKGPFTIGQLRSMWSSCQLTGENLFSTDGGQEWHYLSDIISDLEPAPTVQPIIIQQARPSPMDLLKQAPNYSGYDEIKPKTVKRYGLPIILLIFICLLVYIYLRMFSLSGKYEGSFYLGNVLIHESYDFRIDGTVIWTQLDLPTLGYYSISYVNENTTKQINLTFPGQGKNVFDPSKSSPDGAKHIILHEDIDGSLISDDGLNIRYKKTN